MGGSMHCRRPSSSTGVGKSRRSMWDLPARRISRMAFKNYYKLPRRPVLTALLCLPLLGQSSGYLMVAEAPKVTGQRNAAVQAKIPVTVKAGYHVNSNVPSDEYLIP